MKGNMTQNRVRIVTIRTDSHEGPDKGDKQRMTQFCGKLFKVGQEENVSNNKKKLR